MSHPAPIVTPCEYLDCALPRHSMHTSREITGRTPNKRNNFIDYDLKRESQTWKKEEAS